jgi:hypothetical protein
MLISPLHLNAAIAEYWRKFVSLWIRIQVSGFKLSVMSDCLLVLQLFIWVGLKGSRDWRFGNDMGKRSWHILRYCPKLCWERLNKLHQNLGIDTVCTAVRTWDFWTLHWDFISYVQCCTIRLDGSGFSNLLFTDNARGRSKDLSRTAI